jgi:hypothetical protein
MLGQSFLDVLVFSIREGLPDSVPYLVADGPVALFWCFLCGEKGSGRVLR